MTVISYNDMSSFAEGSFPLRKTCSKCKVKKSADEFWKQKDGKYGLRSACVECLKPQQKKYNAENSEKRNSARKKYINETPEEKLKDIYLRSKYRITLDEFNGKKKLQNNKCAICGRKPEKLCQDHDHISGMVRGLLCQKCNAGIGFLGENIEVLESAIKYLRLWQS